MNENSAYAGLADTARRLLSFLPAGVAGASADELRRVAAGEPPIEYAALEDAACRAVLRMFLGCLAVEARTEAPRLRTAPDCDREADTAVWGVYAYVRPSAVEERAPAYLAAAVAAGYSEGEALRAMPHWYWLPRTAAV